MPIQHHTAKVNDIRLHYVTSGDGPPLFLLHGFPQSWYMWRKVIPALAERFTVVAPDLRGYGDSDKPAGGFDKRTMAQDIIALARSLGYEQFSLAGHDRGGRVAYRCALDHPQAISRLALLDIVPTGVVFDNTNAQLARSQWHWFFFQLADLPELLLGSNISGYLDWTFRNGSFQRHAFDAPAVAEYVRIFSLPGSIRCALEDYRAGGAADWQNDRADAAAGRQMRSPTLVLWGAEAGLGRAWPVLDVWREWATDVRGEAIPECGHYLPEEQPELVAQKLLEFFR
ncbi:MAG: alpha/beta hydrolase [Dehalococcoidia bacterium]|nr:alpha/beta hydrolase [Dehalococcoidia bacterium]MSQ16023.1 alpha/beta hydrolase [Dehalococcoidia bacterium]